MDKRKEKMDNMSRTRKFIISWLVLFGIVVVFGILVASLVFVDNVLGHWGAAVYAIMVLITLLAGSIAVEDG